MWISLIEPDKLIKLQCWCSDLRLAVFHIFVSFIKEISSTKPPVWSGYLTSLSSVTHHKHPHTHFWKSWLDLWLTLSSRLCSARQMCLRLYSSSSSWRRPSLSSPCSSSASSSSSPAQMPCWSPPTSLQRLDSDMCQ